MIERPIKQGRILGLALLTVLLLPVAAKPQDYQHEIDRLAGEVANSATKAGLKNIAVVDFTDLKGNVQEMGRFIAQELTTSLVLTEKPFKTIDRANLRTILEEQKLSMTGLTSTENTKKLKISGVDGLVRGTLTHIDEGIRLNIQVISVENAQIIGAARGTISKTSAMESLGDAVESTTSLRAGSPYGQTTPSKKEKNVFQDKNLRITLKYFRKDSDEKMKAIFIIENLRNTDLDLCWHYPQAIDDQGEQWRSTEQSGISNTPSYPTHISPGSPITALIVFKLESGNNRAAKFNILGPIDISEGNRTMTSSPTFQDIQPGL